MTEMSARYRRFEFESNTEAMELRISICSIHNGVVDAALASDKKRRKIYKLNADTKRTLEINILTPEPESIQAKRVYTTSLQAQPPKTPLSATQASIIRKRPRKNRPPLTELTERIRRRSQATQAQPVADGIPTRIALHRAALGCPRQGQRERVTRIRRDGTHSAFAVLVE